MSIQPVCPDVEITLKVRKHFQQGKVILTMVFLSLPYITCLYDKRKKIKWTTLEVGSMAVSPDMISYDLHVTTRCSEISGNSDPHIILNSKGITESQAPIHVPSFPS